MTTTLAYTFSVEGETQGREEDTGLFQIIILGLRDDQLTYEGTSIFQYTSEGEDPDLLRSRAVEQEVLDLLDEPPSR